MHNETEYTCKTELSRKYFPPISNKALLKGMNLFQKCSKEFSSRKAHTAYALHPHPPSSYIHHNPCRSYMKQFKRVSSINKLHYTCLFMKQDIFLYWTAWPSSHLKVFEIFTHREENTKNVSKLCSCKKTHTYRKTDKHSNLPCA